MSNFFGKKVRFSYKNSFRSPPPTPTLSFTSSIDESENIITPPDPFATHTLPSYQHYLPVAKYNIRIRAHPLLETGAITWNLLDPPSAIEYHRGRLSSRVLREAATSPPVALLQINSPYIPWLIPVYASNGSFVTLEDLFHAIYNSLRRNITPAEFNSLASSRAQARATRAYETRYRQKRTTTEYETEKKGGMKRIDFLTGHTRFLGIQQNSPHSDAWQLNIS